VDELRKSVCGYGHRRIGNRMQIPDGCAAVTDDEGPTNATIPKREGKAGPENDSEVRRPALSLLKIICAASSLECTDEAVSPKTGWDA